MSRAVLEPHPPQYLASESSRPRKSRSVKHKRQCYILLHGKGRQQIEELKHETDSSSSESRQGFFIERIERNPAYCYAAAGGMIHGADDVKEG